MTFTAADRARFTAEHEAKYQAIAEWLGWADVLALVPFSPERVRLALANGDEHLNSLQLQVWDRQHGFHPDDPDHRGTVGRWPKREPCPCCGTLVPAKPTIDRTAGVWGLIRAATRRDVAAGRKPFLSLWSLGDTVCVLKHVARVNALTPEAP